MTPQIVCPWCGERKDPARSSADAAHLMECAARSDAEAEAEP
ncbi:MAG: hypothetical protein M0Z46_10665 [Actinomycetota bacterium]|nr:hypothetical protein [Actinomycetota bacterium]